MTYFIQFSWSVQSFKRFSKKSAFYKVLQAMLSTMQNIRLCLNYQSIIDKFQIIEEKNSKSLGTHRKIFKKNFLSTVCISVYSSYLEWFYINAWEWIFFSFCLTRKYNFDIQLKIYVIFIPSVLPPILPILYQIGKNMESWEVWNNKKKDCLMAECILYDLVLLQ